VSRRRRPLKLSTSRPNFSKIRLARRLCGSQEEGKRGRGSGSKSEIYDETDNVGTHERRIYFRASSPVDKF
jgi:hypothetical protein